LAVLWISTPTDDGDRVVEILPRDTVVLKGLIRDTVWFIFFSGLGLGKLQNVIVQLFDSISSHNTISVHTENVWAVELTINWTVSNEVSHDLLLRSITITFTDEVGALYLGVWLTLRIVAARVTFGLSLVWGALFGDEISIFSEETMEVWPSSVTTLVHIVTHHEVLW